MLDLETLSTKTTALIVSIGAYRFDPYTYEPEFKSDPRPFYVRLRLNLNDMQFDVDPDTLNWWMKQSEETRAEFTHPDRIAAASALTMLMSWIAGERALNESYREDVIIWSHGNFDVPILQHAYEAYHISVPWYYRSPRDLRTIIMAAFGENLDVEEVVEGFPKNEKSHHPVYDAWHQSVMVQECYRRLKMAPPSG